MGDIAPLLASALLSTIAIELPLAVLLFGVRRWRAVCVVILAQVATNPVVELLSLTLGWQPYLPPLAAPWIAILLAEVAATVTEALFYRVSAITDRPWLMSVALNSISFSLGLALFALAP